MKRIVGSLVLACLSAAPAVDASDKPISAIEWLSDSVAQPAAPPARPQGTPPGASDPGVAATAATASVTTSRLGTLTPDAIGLIPASLSGLPPALWGPTAAADLGTRVRSERTDMPPTLQALFLRVLLAQVDPPFDSDARGALLLARIDALLDIGALDQAEALVNRIGPTSSPAIFRRAFDIGLLTGHEDRACIEMGHAPRLSPTYPARIFCLARNGDWDTAALTLGTARALGFIPDPEDALLTRFLDSGLDDDAPLPPQRGPMTPLTFRMLEAIGEAQPTGPLPVAFAASDLRSITGWKAQIEAAERLTRSGALGPERLRALYVERKPAASGGVWDRAAAIQALETAFRRRKPAGIAAALERAWPAMAAAELEPALAAIAGPRLRKVALTGKAAAIAFKLELLTPDFEVAALARTPANETEAYLVGLARGRPPASDQPIPAAITRGFTTDAVPARAQSLVDDHRLGEALLRAMDLVTEGATGELDELTDGLALLRALGFETEARRAALEILILDRRG